MNEETLLEREEKAAAPEPAESDVTLPEIPEQEPANEPEEKQSEEPKTESEEQPDFDDAYRRQAEEDLAEIARLDPTAGAYGHLGEMPGALRFAELRGLGLSVREAYFAVRGASDEKPLYERGGRAHLHGSVPGRAAAVGVGMSAGEIEGARRLFPHLSDREITALYRRVKEN